VKTVEELLVWQRAKAFADAVSALVTSETLRRDAPLRSQLNSSSLSVLSNIAEGFGQKTDRAFARHLYLARGSNHEAATQLAVAASRGYVNPQQFGRLQRLNEETGKMLTGLIKYLQRENRKSRG
jgi:four helix bundle protein